MSGIMFSWSTLTSGLFPRQLKTSMDSPSDKDILPPTIYGDHRQKPDQRTRTIFSLLKANHINHSVLYNHNNFHNHVPHILGSAYILGSSDAQLKAIYDASSSGLEEWYPAPGEITQDDWRDYFGRSEFQRAYLDHFEDRLAGMGYEWKVLVNEVYTTGEHPLINNAMSGLGHGLIHLGYAYELDNHIIATEALTLAACTYDSMHKYIDNPRYTKPALNPCRSLEDLITRAHDDSRFATAFGQLDRNSIELCNPTSDQEELILEYWNAWTISVSKDMLEQVQRLGTGLLLGSTAPGGFDFFLVHLLTTTHALRILLPFLDSRWHVSFLRQWWLFVITTYVSRNRPRIDWDRVKRYDTKGRGWDVVVTTAIDGPHALDEHFVKACRTLKEAAHVWGDSDEFFLRAALRLVDDFDAWKIDLDA